jgi:hypothetical protein
LFKSNKPCRYAALCVFLAIPVQASASSQAQAQPAIDPVTVSVPSLAFTDAGAAKDFDKYFYFWRENVDYNKAYADIVECDAYARGMAFRLGEGGSDFDSYNSYFAQPSLPAVAGDVIGSLIGAALAKPVNKLMDRALAAPKRRTAHRANLRVCMGYKGYRRYGLPKVIWQAFNFDEANGDVAEGTRQRMLIQQARISSGPRPGQPELK